MIKADLVKLVAKKMRITKKAAEEGVTSIFDAITEELAAGGTVALQGFGKFHVHVGKERNGFNPQNGAPIRIAACNTPKFKAGDTLRAAVQGK